MSAWRSVLGLGLGLLATEGSSAPVVIPLRPFGK